MGTDDRPADGGQPAVGRRRFVRQLAGDAVGAAGRIAGMSQVVHSSMVAAGRAFSEGMESIGDAGAAVGNGAPAARPGPTARRAASPVTTPASTPKAPQIAPEVRRILERARTAVMAANQPGAAPQLSVSPVSFDGEALRVHGRAMTARVANLQRDPRVTLAIVDLETGDSVVVSGRAELIYGDDVPADPLTTSHQHIDDDHAIASGDMPVLILVRPERAIRKRGRRSLSTAGDGA
jgi:hypothetical protein